MKKIGFTRGQWLRCGQPSPCVLRKNGDRVRSLSSRKPSMKQISICLAFLLAPNLALAQSAILQGGPWAYGHVPAYSNPGSSQPTVIDSGAARGSTQGQGISELNLQAVGTGTPPYAGQGTGPYGTIHCEYDAPITNATGYHFICFSPNAQGGALIVVGYGGVATPQPLNFIINGVTVTPVACSGSPSSSFAAINGIVTHC
jgi:hypothetical protein